MQLVFCPKCNAVLGSRTVCWNCSTQLARPSPSNKEECLPGDCMRIVTWNVNRRRDNLELAQRELRPDILAVQEIQQPTDGSPWVGERRKNGYHAGVGLFVGSGFHMELGPVTNELRWFLPVHVLGRGWDFNVLVVWVKTWTSQYSQVDLNEMFRSGIRHYREFLLERPAVVLGDFNANLDLVTGELQDFGLVSAYHTTRNERPRCETEHTQIFFGTKKGEPKKEYHFDACFVPQGWLLHDVEIKHWDKQSDHRPLIVDVRHPKH